MRQGIKKTLVGGCVVLALQLAGCALMSGGKPGSVTEQSVLTALDQINENYYHAVAASELYQNALNGVHDYLAEHGHVVPEEIKQQYLSTNPIRKSNFLASLKAPILDYQQRFGLMEDGDELLTVALARMVRSLSDTARYTGAVDPQLASREIGKTGIWYRPYDDALYVLYISPDSPASRAGIQPHSKIISIDGTSISAINRRDVGWKFSGPEGEQVKLEVQAPNSTKRKTYALKYGLYSEITMLSDYTDRNVAYIKMYDISEAPRLLKRTIQYIRESQGRNLLKGLVLDLRDSYGGMLVDVVDVADVFLDRGRVLSTEGKIAEDTLIFNAMKGEEFTGVNMVVLINNNTHAGSALLAQALQQNHRALVIGYDTATTGAVLREYRLANGGAIRIKTGELVTAAGKYLSQEAVTPDVCLRKGRERYNCVDNEPYSKAKEDKELVAAYSALLWTKNYSLVELKENVEKVKTQM